jgi:hypothetical protein
MLTREARKDRNAAIRAARKDRKAARRQASGMYLRAPKPPILTREARKAAKNAQHYYVVNAGRGRSATHIMRSKDARLPRPTSAGSVVAELVIGFNTGPPAKRTLCGLWATRSVADVFTPGQASCRECCARWKQATP